MKKKCILLPGIMMIILCMILSTMVVAQTTVFSDDFSTFQSATWTTAGSIGASSWSVNRSGNDWGARRNTSPAQLEITNDVGGTTNVAGWAFAYLSTASLSSPYEPALNQNPGLVSWTFNMRQIRTDPSGFATANYGIAFVLSATQATVNSSGNGYAVVLGQSGSTDPLRLARFTTGLSGTLTSIITSNTAGLTDFGTDYLSVKVTYDPSTDNWELFVRNDGTSAFVDPSTGTLTSQGTAADNTYTASSFSFLGAYWQGSTSANQTAFFDNVSVSVISAPVVLQEQWRSRTSGAWDNVSTWQQYNGSTWVNATEYPGQNTPTEPDPSASVQPDHVVTVLGPVEFGDIEVQSGGTLVIQDAVTLSVPAGKTLTVNGIMTMQDEARVNGAGAFLLNSGGRLNIGSVEGITVADAAGNIRTAGGRTYSSGAIFMYKRVADADMVTGDGLTQHTPADLIISNSGSTVTLSAPTTISRNLNITGGTLDADNNNLSVGGNWSSSGTFLPGNATVTFFGPDAATIASSTFNHVVFSGSGSKTAGGALTIGGNLTITDNFSAGSVTHAIAGDWVNNGTFSAGTSTINFNGTNDLQTISGSSTTTFNILRVAKGAQHRILEVLALIGLSGASNPLVIADGTFKLSSPSVIQPFTTSAGATIPGGGGFWNNGGTILPGNYSWVLYGTFRQSAGTTYIGTAEGQALRYRSNSIITIEGGELSIAGRLGRDNSTNYSTTYTQTGGIVTLNTVGLNNSTFACFDLGNPASSFHMSDGYIVLQRRNANAGLEYLNLAGTCTVTGGTLQVGNAGTPASQYFRIKSQPPLWNLVINDVNDPQVEFYHITHFIQNDCIIGGSLWMTNTDLVLGGDWYNNGNFDPGTATVFMSGTAPQIIGGSFPSSFYHLQINNGNGVFLDNNITVSHQLDLNTGLLTTNAFTLTAEATALIQNASALSYINGRLARVYDAVGSKEFPIGKGGNYRPLTFNYSALSGSSTVMAEQFESAMSGSLPPQTSLLTADRYWEITQTGGSDYEYFVTLDPAGYTPLNPVVMLKKDGGTISSHPTTSPDYTNALAFNSLSEFALGEYNSIITQTFADSKEVCRGETTLGLTASVSPVPDGGTIQFYLEGTAVGSPVPVSTIDGTATYTYNPGGLADGGYAIRADFSGNGNYLPGSSHPGNDGVLTVFDLPAAPAGSDVNETDCFGTPYTGSATAGSNEYIIWYDASSGGNVTVAPSRSTPGTSLAWAAAVDNTTQCESETRTLVTVTLTADTELPQITCPQAISVNAAPGQCYAIVLNPGIPITSDNCAVFSVDNDAPANGQYSVGIHLVTWTVYDVNGNSATCTQQITVNDNQKPLVQCPLPLYLCIEPELTGLVINGIQPVTGDNCGVSSVTWTASGVTNTGGSNDASGTFFNVGQNWVTYTVTDVNKNTSTCSFSIQIYNRPVAQASVNPGQYCQGEEVTLEGSAAGGSGTGYQYAWLGPGGYTGAGQQAVIGDIQPGQSGQYILVVTDSRQCASANDASVSITVLPLPEVSFTGSITSSCLDSSPVFLTGGYPEGGSYSGNGVVNGVFYPVLSGAGFHVITYAFTGGNGCTNFATNTAYVYSSIQSAVTVGSGGDYPNLSGNGGLFEAVNSLTLCGNLEVRIISDLNEPGTHALNQWSDNGFGPYTMTIMPDQPVLRNITGNVASDMIRFNGADGVIIDGSFDGEGRYLLFRNLASYNSTFTYLNDATNHTLRNCIIEGCSRVTTGGVLLLSNGAVTGNDNFLIENSIFRNASPTVLPNNLIGSNSSIAQHHSDIVIRNNVFSDFRSSGILVTGAGGGSGFTIADNVFYCSLPQSMAQTVINFAPGLATTANVISGNRIGGSDETSGGTPWTNTAALQFRGIYVKSGNFSIENNEIGNITLSSTGAAAFTGIELAVIQGLQSQVKNNTIGSASLANAISIAGTGAFTGILVASTIPVQLLESNTIANITYTSTGTGSPVIAGIKANKALLRKNRIYEMNVNGLNFTPTMYGVWFNGPSGASNECSNNMISMGGGAVLNPLICGIYEGSAANTTAKYYYNTVNIYGTASSTKKSYCFYRQNSVNVTIKNNIFSNFRSASPLGQYAIYTVSGTYWTYCDYNDLYSATAPIAGWVGADKATFALWKTASGKDAQSVNVMPVYFSNTDLHLMPSNTGIDGKGNPIATYTTDIDGNIRNVATPDIGCDEFTAVLPRLEEEGPQQADLRVYPNPFTSVTSLELVLPEDGVVELCVYNLLGERVGEIRQGMMYRGIHTFSFRAEDLPAGMYFCRMVVEGKKTIVKRMQLLK